MSSLLRAVQKLPINRIQLPKLELPPGYTWGGNQPVKKGFEQFYNPSIQSMLCLPTNWYTYESEYQMEENNLSVKSVLSSREDIQKLGYFNTGVTFTLFQPIDRGQGEEEKRKKIHKAICSAVAEGLHENTLKEVHENLGGSTEWIEYGEQLQMSSLRYTSEVPEIAFASGGVAPAENMLFIQDLAWEKERNFVFVMKFETPKKNFFSVHENSISSEEEIFKTIKTSGYFATGSNDEQGLVFLQL